MKENLRKVRKTARKISGIRHFTIWPPPQDVRWKERRPAAGALIVPFANVIIQANPHHTHL
ncbi:hypothetical protein [Noviherbaspirillum sp.]|uniref:hypothetical protein n=1 Tax=Noviherbaspirillum sp. TaxID=1926288 RepID=UPI002D713265|nr:hypothetical protein [Noviherbaspirillum sp.]HZW23033.1 hypothetical protein [Noviherbaspirillum sp.]